MAMKMFKKLQVTAVDDDNTFDMFLVDGAEPSSLSKAVAARAGIPNNSQFFLTTSGDRDGTVVPLSASLPDGLQLFLHRAEGERRVLVRRHSSRRSRASSDDFHDLEAQATLKKLGHHHGRDQPLLDPTTTATTASGSSHDAPPPANSGMLAVSLQIPSSNHWASHHKHSKDADEEHPNEEMMGTIISRVEEEMVEHVDHMCNAMERFQRLATDLANERTFLAWTRTYMAAMRTVFAFYAMVGLTHNWNLSVVFCEVVLCGAIFLMIYMSRHRYSRMKQIIGMKNPPESYGRLSIRYVHVLMVIVALTMATGVFTRQWGKAGSHH